MITIDLEKRTIDLEVAPDVVRDRLSKWKAPAPRYDSGVFAKYVVFGGKCCRKVRVTSRPPLTFAKG